MSRIKQVIETLEAERAELRERLDWLDRQIEEFRTRDVAVAARAPAPPPARSKRRATASRASRRRATARSLKPDVEAKIVAYLDAHPKSTAGDVAKGLDLPRTTTAPLLIKMTKAGDVKKASRGYVVA